MAASLNTTYTNATRITFELVNDVNKIISRQDRIKILSLNYPLQDIMKPYGFFWSTRLNHMH